MALNYHMEILTKGDIQEGGKISIPSYQRGIVWKLKHKKEFLESVKNGDPIGVVLVYKEQDGTYTLIDGLQRLSTIKAYMTNPLAFIDEKDKFINETLIETIIKEKYKSQDLPAPNEASLAKQKKQFKKKLLELMKDRDMPNPEDIWEELCNQLQYPNTVPMLKQFLKFYRSFQTNLKLDDDVKIQAIVYDGLKENLPTVFHNLNTGSVSLTKYEVFASIWPKTQMVFDDEEILEKVISKYENLRTSSNFDVEVSEEDLREKGLTLFEYCYAMSEILTDSSKDYYFLFDNGTEKKSTDPIGFDLLALACGLAVNKAQTLCEDGYLKGCSPLFLTGLKNALVDCVSIVSETLKKWVFDYRLHNLKNDSLYQIYHMVISVFKHRYNLDLTLKTIELKTGNEATEWLGRFKKYAHIHYLHDAVTNFWSINRQVSDLKRELDSEDSISKYTYDLPRDKIEQDLLAFSEDSLAKSTGKNPDLTTKLLLNYYYKLKEVAQNRTYFARAAEDSDGTVTYSYDIEHIVPKEKFEAFPDETFSRSYIGNLCYLSIKDNRSKRDLTLYEYADLRPALEISEDFVRFIDYPSREELGFLDCSLEDFKIRYSSFIKNRGERVLKDLAALLANE